MEHWINIKTASALVILGSLLVMGCHRSKADKDVVSKQYMHRYGVEVAQEDWKDCGSHGQVIQQLKNGVTIKQSFHAGKLHGVTTYSFPYRDEIEHLQVYDQGHLISETWNYASGVPLREKIYKSDGFITATTWYEEGSPQCLEQYRDYTLLEGEYWTLDAHSESQVVSGQGERTLRDGQGQLLAKEEISKGEVVFQQSFYPNGNPKQKVCFLKGKIEGQKLTFFADGSPSTVEEWTHGQQHGLTTCFENGQKVSECHYAYGKKEGCENWYKGGKDLCQSVNWHNNQQHGPTTFYAAGKEMTEWYYEGKQVTRTHYIQLTRGIVQASKPLPSTSSLDQEK